MDKVRCVHLSGLNILPFHSISYLTNASSSYSLSCSIGRRRRRDGGRGYDGIEDGRQRQLNGPRIRWGASIYLDLLFYHFVSYLTNASSLYSTSEDLQVVIWVSNHFPSPFFNPSSQRRTTKRGWRCGNCGRRAVAQQSRGNKVRMLFFVSTMLPRHLILSLSLFQSSNTASGDDDMGAMWEFRSSSKRH